MSQFAIKAILRAVMAMALLFPLGHNAVMANEPLVLALSKTPLSLPFYVAESEGYFTAEGITLKLDELVGGHRTMQQLLDGKADLATSSEAVVMFSSLKHDEFAVLASFVSSANDVKVIVNRASGVTNPRQLAGKRVGTIVGSASNYYLDTLALLNGVDPKALKIVSLQPEMMEAALRKNKVDAVAVWQPFAYQIERAVAGAQQLDDGAFYSLTFNLAVSRKLIGRRDQDLVALLRALDRAEHFIASKPQKAQEILRRRLQLDQHYIDWLWPRYRYQLTLDQSFLTTLESEARWARQEGYAKSDIPPNFLKFIHSAPLRQVNPSAVSLIE